MVGYITKFVSNFFAYCDGHRKASLTTFNDPIHGTVQLDPIMQKIINTPEFQRLRHIKQLGSTFYVYPLAQHTRFAHSIGTAHLAGKLVKHLKERQPELDITDKDVLCVEIAGLCHDLGHGPFSHLFDQDFLPRLKIWWKHEQGSCDMFDKIMKRLEDDEDIKKLSPDDRTFIKEMINVPKASPFRGRGKEKSFLYEIISNKVCGADVDKWDYFARDCYHLGIPNGFDYERFIKFTKVLEVEEDGRRRKHICVREKEAFNLYLMFHTRYTIHKRACQHRKKNAIDHMICDALVAADDHVCIPGEGGHKGCRISDCINNMEYFCNLDDRVLQKIEHHPSNHPDIKKAKEILRRIIIGDHYEMVEQKVLQEDEQNLTENEVTRQLVDKDPSLKDKIKVSVLDVDYGRGAEDPVSKMWFYSDDEPDKAKKVVKNEVSRLLPEVLQEKILQVFCMDRKLVDAARYAFREQFPSPQSVKKAQNHTALD